MTRRRRHRGERRAALFTWHDAVITVPDQVFDNPLARTCQHCHASIGNPCTRPGPRGTRIRTSGYHDSRTTPQETT